VKGYKTERLVRMTTISVAGVAGGGRGQQNMDDGPVTTTI
jgi:hypothetical protein